ncbi:MAG: AAA family ATPase [Bacillaceae bacterium]|nr:AAA family ATPase [Bacillaceae bacterium]
MRAQWYYFSDTNSPHEDLESVLEKRQHEMKMFQNLEQLELELRHAEHAVVFLRSNTMMNVYTICQDLSILYPHFYIVIITPNNMENVKKAMLVGASNTMRYTSDVEEVKNVVIQAEKYLEHRTKLTEQRITPLPLSSDSTVISVASPRGGTGRTMLVTNLAAALAKRGQKVAIIDADLQFGDVAMFFDVKPKLSIYEWVKEAYEDHPASIEKYMVHHPSGVSILSAPPRPEFFEMVTATHMKAAIQELKKLFHFILIDTPSFLSEIHLTCIGEANEVLLLTSAELPTIRNCKLYMETMETLGLKEKIRPILNKELKSKILTTKDVEGILESPFYAKLPHNESLVCQSINQGIPFVLSNSRVPISKNIYVLANQLASPLEEKKERKGKEKRWFSFS